MQSYRIPTLLANVFVSRTRAGIRVGNENSRSTRSSRKEGPGRTKVPQGRNTNTIQLVANPLELAEDVAEHVATGVSDRHIQQPTRLQPSVEREAVFAPGGVNNNNPTNNASTTAREAA